MIDFTIDRLDNILIDMNNIEYLYTHRYMDGSGCCSTGGIGNGSGEGSGKGTNWGSGYGLKYSYKGSMSMGKWKELNSL